MRRAELQSPPDHVLVAGEFWNGAAARGFAQAFRSLGMDVTEIDFRDLFIGSGMLGFRVLNRFLQERAPAEYNKRILDAARRYKPRFFFTVKGSFVDRETIEALKSDGIVTINFYPDVAFNHPTLGVDQVLDYDLVATTKSFHLPFLQSRTSSKIVHIDHGYAPLTHRPHRNPDRVADGHDFDWDISYVGIASPHKVAWLETVVDAFGHLRFAVFGNGWERLARGTPLERFVRGYPVLGDFYADTIERSRINLAMHFGPVGEENWQDAVSSRTFHIPASGGFMLHIDNPEVQSLYDVPSEIDVFASPAQLIERIAHHLEHEDERQRIAARGHARCAPAYSLEMRARAILDSCQALGR